MEQYNCIVVLGPTASGKTRLACELAYYLDGEIISADSRQVYKGLDIGTGKDLEEYQVREKNIPYHLIDMIDASEQFFLHQFAEECEEAYHKIMTKGRMPIICGGTGLYLDALRKDFSFTRIGENDKLREELKDLSKEELLNRLEQYPADWTQHTDRHSVKRIVRAIEIAEYRSANPIDLQQKQLPYHPYYIGISPDQELRKTRIAERLAKRLKNGMIEEVRTLLKKGITHHRLELFGLEYKFISRYLQGILTETQMQEQLQTAIFQFAKRQMTWFRKMEKEGVTIHWVDSDTDPQRLAEAIRPGFRSLE